MTGRRFDTEIQTRFRDINVGGHVDNVEAVRVIDEARIQFFMFAPVFDDRSPESRPGLLRNRPAGIVELMGSQRVDYHAEMRFIPYTPFLVRIWVSRLGRSSFTVATQMRTSAEHPPALVAESSFVFWNSETATSWEMDDAVRADLEQFHGPGVGLRP
ncbi:hypothetical protein EFK50_12325 [Nocardioides marmoriginsengisoli]|uniref:Acyl-CoA thioesterase n=1 Tax=Nocardioides marmoriginsengisoli TaxID=661483 RepID=A0A3N0CGI4_9ACTN|nr:thioesterase family protein [Nocardioides marmoriginsengisoli]RNL62548.1 hypothetical protein EFK50_12325 [Nocardioides marmoriginsengisoli]